MISFVNKHASLVINIDGSDGNIFYILNQLHNLHRFGVGNEKTWDEIFEHVKENGYSDNIRYLDDLFGEDVTFETSDARMHDLLTV